MGAQTSTEAKDDQGAPPASDYELAITACKELEYLLVQEFGSKGRTMNEKINTANYVLPVDLLMDLRYISSVRDNILHEKFYDCIPEREVYIVRYKRSVQRLIYISKLRRFEEEQHKDLVIKHYRQKFPEPVVFPEQAPTEKPGCCAMACF